MKYRPEIDGLRAVAVLPVILFHAGFSTFSGGFVGVDVFFVISGYLITSIILKDLEAGTFSFWEFYERRARRILPALFFVIICCIPFAWMWMMPMELKAFATSVVAVSVFMSNILFWRQSGYFDQAAELKPLLHTWSLAVEEQFYIFFPIAMLILWRFGRKNVVAAIVLVAVFSLALSEYGSRHHPSFNFYWLPTRAWELAAGSLCALVVIKPKAMRDELLAVAGLAAILVAVFYYDETTPFPSLYALVPVLGTCAIILFARHGTIVGSLLSLNAFVGIGLISYSAYLWHQPIFVFARYYYLEQLHNVALVCLALGSLFLGWLSFFFVETPFRKAHLVGAKFFAPSVVFVLTTFVLIGAFGVHGNGFPSRFASVSSAKPWEPPIKCHGREAVKNYEHPLRECLSRQKNHRQGDIFLIGDSHAAQLTFPLKAVASRTDAKVYFINTEDPNDFPYSFFSADNSSQDRIIEHILNVADAGDYLIVAFHRGHLNEVRDSHIPLETVVGENQKARNFVANMNAYLPRLVSAGIHIILVKDTPLLSYKLDVAGCKYFAEQRNQEVCRISRRQDEHTRLRQERAFSSLSAAFPESIRVLDPNLILYGSSEFFSPIYADGSYKMFDQHHLTEPAALELTSLFQFMLR